MDCNRFPDAGDDHGLRLTKEFLLQCAEDKGTIPKGALVYRGDNRFFAEISAAQIEERGIKKNKKPGFVPGVHPDDKNRVLELARQQAAAIREIKNVGDFIFQWKYKVSDGCYKDLIIGYKGFMRGVSCGTEGAQMGGNHYRIRLPEMFVTDVIKDNGKMIVFYGNTTDLSTSTVIWMNLYNGSNAEEMVSLTEIPIEWIEEI